MPAEKYAKAAKQQSMYQSPVYAATQQRQKTAKKSRLGTPKADAVTYSGTQFQAILPATSKSLDRYY